MIPVPSGVRVWLAVGRTDMRPSFCLPTLECSRDTNPIMPRVRAPT